MSEPSRPTSYPPLSQPRPFYHRLWFFAVLCLTVFLFGGLFQPGQWYATLDLAPWSPPNIAFPIVWSALYVLIALSGYQLASSRNLGLLKVWYLQLALNALWSWLFFGQHWTVLGLTDLIILLCLVSYLIINSLKRDNENRKQLMAVALMLTPYLLWLGLATSLNAYIVIYN